MNHDVFDEILRELSLLMSTNELIYTRILHRKIDKLVSNLDHVNVHKEASMLREHIPVFHMDSKGLLRKDQEYLSNQINIYVNSALCSFFVDLPP